MYRAAFIALPLLFAPAALPAPAAAASAIETQSRTGENCEQQNQRNRRRGRGIGGLLGGFVPQLGGAAGVVTSILPVGSLLGEAIAGMLDCREQQQAANATEQAV